MCTARIVLLSGKGKITNVILDVMPEHFDVQCIYFDNDSIQNCIQKEKGSLALAEAIILNLSEATTDCEPILSLLKKQSDAPIILLHLYQQKTFTEAFIKMGAAAYLPVNFNPSIFLNTIEKVVQQKSNFSPSA